MLGPRGVVVEDRERYERGYRYGKGQAAAIVLPSDLDQVRQIIRYSHDHQLKPLPQGAHTGLVGAGTPDETGKQIVISLQRLNQIIDYAPLDRTMTCGAGTLLSTVNQHAGKDDLFFPIDLGADPSIGGMVATNTGGAKLLRYGDVRRNLLGLEAVLFDADATVWSDLGGLRKDNTGIDMKQMFVGSGGQLGVITAATLDLQCTPRQSACALLTPRRFEDVPNITARLEGRLGEFLVACEGMSSNAMSMALRHHPSLRNPFESQLVPPFALLVQVATSVPPELGLDVESILAEAVWPMMEGGDALLENAIVTTSGDFFALRHSISDGLAREGQVLAFDIATSRSRMPSLVTSLTDLSKQLAPQALPCYFGHFGDGGVHFNLVLPRDDHSDHAALRDAIYSCVAEQFSGSISAEHGIGPFNQSYYTRYVPAWKRDAAHSIQRMFNIPG